MGLIILSIGGMAVIVGGTVVMHRFSQESTRQFERRREEWRAAGMEGPSPGEGLRGSSGGSGG